MSNPTDKKHADSSTPISAELKLHIIETVEQRLTKLPAETFKLIQGEVDARVKLAERHYVRLATVAGIAIAIVMAGFFKVTTDNAAETVAKSIASTEVKKQVDQIQQLLRQTEDTGVRIASLGAQGMTTDALIKARLQELQQMSNVVTYNADGSLTLKPRNGVVHLIGTAGADYDLTTETNGLNVLEIPYTPGGKPKKLNFLMAD